MTWQYRSHQNQTYKGQSSTERQNRDVHTLHSHVETPPKHSYGVIGPKCWHRQIKFKPTNVNQALKIWNTYQGLYKPIQSLHSIWVITHNQRPSEVFYTAFRAWRTTFKTLAMTTTSLLHQVCTQVQTTAHCGHMTYQIRKCHTNSGYWSEVTYVSFTTTICTNRLARQTKKWRSWLEWRCWTWLNAYAPWGWRSHSGQPGYLCWYLKDAI